MKRKLFNLGAAGSLLLCIAAAALLVRSYWRADLATYSVGNQLVGMTSIRGRIIFSWDINYPAAEGLWCNFGIPNPEQHVPGMTVQHAGFGLLWKSIARPPPQSSTEIRALMFPDWLMLILAGAMGFVLYRISRKVESSAMVCAVCGYDLRATPDRCPECGATPHAAPRAAG